MISQSGQVHAKSSKLSTEDTYANSSSILTCGK